MNVMTAPAGPTKVSASIGVIRTVWGTFTSASGPVGVSATASVSPSALTSVVDPTRVKRPV
jgi:hypothetical protein